MILRLAVPPDRRDVLRLDVVVAVDLTRLQGLQASRVVGDRTEDETAKERLLAPVRVVADERELVPDLPRLELVGAGSDGMLRAVGTARHEHAVRAQRSLVRAVLLQRRRAGDAEGEQRQRAEERPERPLQLDDRRVPARLAALVERLRRVRTRLEAAEDEAVVVRDAVALQRTREVVPTVEVVTDRLRVERRAVVELDALAQGERPGLSVR